MRCLRKFSNYRHCMFFSRHMHFTLIQDYMMRQKFCVFFLKRYPKSWILLYGFGVNIPVVPLALFCANIFPSSSIYTSIRVGIFPFSVLSHCRFSGYMENEPLATTPESIISSENIPSCSAIRAYCSIAFSRISRLYHRGSQRNFPLFLLKI